MFCHSTVVIVVDVLFSNLTSKYDFKNTIRISNSLNPDQTQRWFGSDQDQTECKGYQQTTKGAAII